MTKLNPSQFKQKMTPCQDIASSKRVLYVAGAGTTWVSFDEQMSYIMKIWKLSRNLKRKMVAAGKFKDLLMPQDTMGE